MPQKTLQIAHWKINTETGEMTNTVSGSEANHERIDPQGVKLLMLLAEHNGELVSKTKLLDELWPNTLVNEDALSRCISRVRKSLGDPTKSPMFIETIPKRGYRLIAPSSELSDSNIVNAETASFNPVASDKRRFQWMPIIALVLIALFAYQSFFPNLSKEEDKTREVIQQADSYYHQVGRKQNEMAYELYQQVSASDPSYAEAYSGMANAIVQRMIRLPTHEDATDWQSMNLEHALSDGRLFLEDRKRQLQRALQLAEKSIELAPNNTRTHKAHGFVLSALNQLEEATVSYHQALLLDASAWDVLINLGDVNEISGQLTNAIVYYKKAFEASKSDSQNSKAWRASLGASIGNKYFSLNNVNEAEIWFRHTLSFAPFDTASTIGLANILGKNGQSTEKKRLCDAYLERIGESVCQ